MKRMSLGLAAAVVLIANLFAVLHVWGNRAGRTESDIRLTQRELYLTAGSTDDSEVTLTLTWNASSQSEMVADPAPAWMDPANLREIGFDTSVAPSKEEATEFYQRQQPRRAYVALEYDGPAWRQWRENSEKELRNRAYATPKFLLNQAESHTRLFAIDAGADAARLRARHPDRGSVIIAPAVIRIYRQAAFEANAASNIPKMQPKLVGAIEGLPASIHVPRPFSDGLRGRIWNPAYVVHLRYGSSLEPWVVGVEFPKTH